MIELCLIFRSEVKGQIFHFVRTDFAGYIFNPTIMKLCTFIGQGDAMI